LSISYIPITGKPTKYSGKPPGVFTAKKSNIARSTKDQNGGLFSNEKTSLADGESFLRIFQIQSLSNHRKYTRYNRGRQMPSLHPKSSGCENTEGVEGCRLRWNST